MSTAVRKQTSLLTEKLKTPEEIHAHLAKVFQDSQGSMTGHKRQVIMIRALQERANTLGLEDSFNDVFCTLINKVLVVKRTEPVGDRIAKLVSAFITTLQDDYDVEEEKGEGEGQEEGEEDTLSSRFIHMFIIHLLRGIESKDKTVRYRVVQLLDFIMGGMREIDDELYESLLFQLDKRIHDKEPYIRIKALHCIARFQDGEEIDEATGKLIVAIQNDPSPEVRRAALLNLVKNETTTNYLLERARDTNAINRRLVYSRVVKEIGDFRTIRSSTREKLLSWGLKDRDESVQKACVKMFGQDWLATVDGDLIELLERLHISTSEVAELAMKKFFDLRRDLTSKITFPQEIWSKLTPEIAFLARSFYEHCNENTLNDVIDANYPESAELAALLTKYLQERSKIRDLSDDDEQDITFVILQLLTIAVDYDFSDEIGRRAMLQVVRSSLANDKLTDELCSAALQVLKKLSINERDFSAMVSEIITDIYDIEYKEDMSKEDESKMTYCLSIAKAMLRLLNEPLSEHMSVDSLIDLLLNPAVRSRRPHIRELGTEALGLCCLLDVNLATDQLYLFGLCLSRGEQKLRLIAIKAMFDILSVHGTKVLDAEDGVDSLSFHKLLYKTLKNDQFPELQALCAEGLCKLYLADVLTDDELFETLVLTYYNPVNAENQGLLQAFAFCLPVYCFSHQNHQQKMSSIAADAFTRLYSAHVDEMSDQETQLLSPSLILQQLTYWTDPANVVNRTEEEVASTTTHLDMAIDFLKTFDGRPSKKYRKTVLMTLSKFNIGNQVPLEKVEDLLNVIDKFKEEIEEDLDTPGKNAIRKLQTRIEAIEKDIQGRHVVSQEDKEFSVILEQNEEEDKEEAAGEEDIDEEFEKEQSRVINNEDEESSSDEEESDSDEDVGDDLVPGGRAHSSLLDSDGDLSMDE